MKFILIILSITMFTTSLARELTEVNKAPERFLASKRIDRSIDRSKDRSIDRSKDRSIDRSKDRSVDRSKDRSINKSKKKSSKKK